MKRTAKWLAWIGALCAGAPALAQIEAPDQDSRESDIVVTGEVQPPTRKEVYDQALSLSRVDPGRLYEQPMARFAAPLCPGVSGLKGEAAVMMVDRVRQNAERLRVPLAKARCAPNLVIAFVDDGRSFLARLERQHPAMFDLIAPSERSELLVQPQPVRVWSRIEPRWATGAPLPRWRGKIQWPSVRGSVNKFFLPTRTDIDFALVLFDREAVLGMTVLQLADYATMRGLSHTRPATGQEALSTILALFEGEGGEPAELTSFDIGFLRSLYFWRPDLSAVNKLLGVRRRAAEAREALARGMEPATEASEPGPR